MAREGLQPLSPSCQRLTYDPGPSQARLRQNSLEAFWAPTQIHPGLPCLPGKGQAWACGSACWVTREQPARQKWAAEGTVRQLDSAQGARLGGGGGWSGGKAQGMTLVARSPLGTLGSPFVKWPRRTDHLSDLCGSDIPTHSRNQCTRVTGRGRSNTGTVSLVTGHMCSRQPQLSHTAAQ